MLSFKKLQTFIDMAVIQRLRNSGWVAVVIVTALVLFVVGDWLTGKGNGGSVDENQDVIAEANGEKYREAELVAIVDEFYKQEIAQDANYKLDEANTNKLFQRAWNELLKRKLLLTEIDLSGVTLSKADENELLVGEHPNDNIATDQSFQTDGKFDPNKVKMMINEAKVNPQNRQLLANYINNIFSNEKEMRYATYVAKAQNFKSKKEIEYDYLAANQSVNGKVIAMNISKIADKDIKISDDDLEDYLNANKEKYSIKQESRSLKYVVFDLTPSRTDTIDAYEQAARFAEVYQKQASKPDTLGAIGFVRITDLKDPVPAIIKDSLWSASNGTVLGPIYDKGKFSVYQKVASEKDTVPMVNVSHILIPMSGTLPNQTVIKDSIESLAKAKEVYDMVAGGKQIADLASLYSGDQGSANNGGSYGWADPRNYVAEYKAFCMTARKGQVGLVKTQFGYHIMKAMEEPDYQKMKFVMNTIEILPGRETVDKVDQASRKLKNQINPDMPESFDKAVEKMALIPRVELDFTTDKRSLGSISDMSDVKQLMNWLFNEKREMNEISEVFAFPTKHVIIKLENVKHVGYATLDNVRTEVEKIVRDQKKAEVAGQKIADALAKNKNAEAVAQSLQCDYFTTDVVRYGQGFLPQIGNEFSILGVVFGLPDGVTSKPIIGKQVAAVVIKDKSTKLDVPVSAYNIPNQEDYSSQPQFVLNRLQEILTTSANVSDMRYKFEWHR